LELLDLSSQLRVKVADLGGGEFGIDISLLVGARRMDKGIETADNIFRIN
jgi:hypothetical protein